MKDFLDIWSDENASELELLPILAVILSPSLCNISYFNEKIKENAHKFLRDKLLDMKEDDEDVFMETSNSTPKPVETLDLMDRYKITKNLSLSLSSTHSLFFSINCLWNKISSRDRLRIEMSKEKMVKNSTRSPRKRDELSKYFDLIEGKNGKIKRRVRKKRVRKKREKKECKN